MSINRNIFFGLILTFISMVDSIIAQTPKTQWIKGNTSTTLYSMSTGNDIATDKNGNVFTVGSFYDTCDFDPGNGVYQLVEHESRPDIYIQKLDASGNFIWAKRIGGVNDQDANAIAVDQLGNTYITGYFEDTIDFDPGTGVFNLMTYQRNSFLLKLDASGNFTWAKSFRSASTNIGRSLALDANANIYLTGTFYDTTDFDPNAGITNLTSNGLGDVFVVKLDTDGNLKWAKQIGGVADDNGYGIALDQSKNVYLTGSYGAAVDFDPNSGIQIITSVNSDDTYILKLNEFGAYRWAKSVGGSQSDIPCSIALDASNNIYIGGDFGANSFIKNATCDFDPGTGVFNLTTNSYSDLFVLKLNNVGDFEWAKRIGGIDINEERMKDIIVDDSGYIYSTGYFDFTIDFDPNAGVYNLTSSNANGYFDVFITKYNGAGNLIWARNYGGKLHDLAAAITSDKKGNIYATGSYQDTAYFYPEDSTKILLSGFQGSYVLKVGQGENNSNVRVDNLNKNIVIYPNPNNGDFTISLKHEGNFSILNQLGEIVYSFIYSGEIREVKTLNLSPGIYFITGEIGEKTVREKIIVLN